MTMVDRFTSIIDVFDDTTVGLSLDQVAARGAAAVDDAPHPRSSGPAELVVTLRAGLRAG